MHIYVNIYVFLYVTYRPMSVPYGLDELAVASETRNEINIAAMQCGGKASWKPNWIAELGWSYWGVGSKPLYTVYPPGRDLSERCKLTQWAPKSFMEHCGTWVLQVSCPVVLLCRTVCNSSDKLDILLRVKGTFALAWASTTLPLRFRDEDHNVGLCSTV